MPIPLNVETISQKNIVIKLENVKNSNYLVYLDYGAGFFFLIKVNVKQVEVIFFHQR